MSELAVFAAVYAVAFVAAQWAAVYGLGWYDRKFGGPAGTFLFTVEAGTLPGAVCAALGYAAARYARLRGPGVGRRPRLGLAAAAATVAAAGLLPLSALPLRRGAGDYAWFPLYFWYLGGGALLVALVGRFFIVARADGEPASGRVAA